MGQAKQRLLAGEMPYQQADYKGTQKEQIVAAVESILAEARQQVAQSSEVEDGRNCLYTAVVVERLLKPLLPTMPVRSAVGYANWRVNAEHPAGALGHNPNSDYPEAGMSEYAFTGHAWVVVGEKYIVDLTSSSWQFKLDTLAKTDGHFVKATWEADYLILDIAKDIKSLAKVAADYSHGAYYEEQSHLQYVLETFRLTQQFN